MTNKKFTLACLTAATTFTTAQAAVILQYDSLLATSTGDGGISGSATALTRVVSDSTLVASSDDYNLIGNRGTFAAVHGSQAAVAGSFADQNDLLFRFGNGTTAGNGTLNGALNVGHVSLGPYISFTFTAAQDQTLDDFSYHLFNNSGSGTSYGARDSGLFVAVDGGAFAQFGALDTGSTGNGNKGIVSFTDTLALNAGQSVEIRLGFTDRTRTNNDLQAATRIGDVSISASPIPEPSSTALLGLSGLALILRRRKA